MLRIGEYALDLTITAPPQGSTPYAVPITVNHGKALCPCL